MITLPLMIWIVLIIWIIIGNLDFIKFKFLGLNRFYIKDLSSILLMVFEIA